MPSERNIVWHPEAVQRGEKEKLLGQKGCCFWFTGLSGSGKSTLAQALARRLHDEGRYTLNLDGDNMRHGLCRDLGFSDADRSENIRRIAEIVKLAVANGMIVLTSFISPFKKDRLQARQIIGVRDFVEVYVDCPLEICGQRDPKGLYAKAKEGRVENFTGVTSGYEAPEQAEIHLQTGTQELQASLKILYERSLLYFKR